MSEESLLLIFQIVMLLLGWFDRTHHGVCKLGHGRCQGRRDAPAIALTRISAENLGEGHFLIDTGIILLLWIFTMGDLFP